MEMMDIKSEFNLIIKDFKDMGLKELERGFLNIKR